MTVDRVEMRDIRKSYGALDVLRGVDLRVAPGEVIGLIGDNGAGRTSTPVEALSVWPPLSRWEMPQANSTTWPRVTSPTASEWTLRRR